MSNEFYILYKNSNIYGKHGQNWVDPVKLKRFYEVST